MISDSEYKAALDQKEAAESVINQFHKERADAFDKRMQDNPIFTDDELRYAATARCSCGAGLAYPKGCPMTHYWDCSAILKGTADPAKTHSAQLPFAFYSIISEDQKSRSGGMTTRPE